MVGVKHIRAGVDLPAEDLQDHASGPPARDNVVRIVSQKLDVPGSRRVLFPEESCDLRGGPSLQRPLEDLLHHRCGMGFRDEPVPVIWIGHGPEGSAVAAAKAGILTELHHLTALPGGLPGKPVMDQVEKGEEFHLPVPEGIHIVQYGQEPDAVTGKELFGIVGALQIIAAEPGDVCHDHRVNAAPLDLPEHLLEAGTVKVGAGDPDVGIMPERREAVFIGKALQKLFLMFDGQTVDLRLTFAGNALIQGGVFFHDSFFGRRRRCFSGRSPCCRQSRRCSASVGASGDMGRIRTR